MKMIHSFESDQSGMFVELANDAGALALNLNTGDVQLEESDSGGVLRSVILGAESLRFALYPALRGKAWELRFFYGTNRVLKVGITFDQTSALKWLNQANEVFDKVRQRTLVFYKVQSAKMPSEKTRTGIPKRTRLKIIKQAVH